MIYLDRLFINNTNSIHLKMQNIKDYIDGNVVASLVPGNGRLLDYKAKMVNHPTISGLSVFDMPKTGNRVCEYKGVYFLTKINPSDITFSSRYTFYDIEFMIDYLDTDISDKKVFYKLSSGSEIYLNNHAASFLIEGVGFPQVDHIQIVSPGQYNTMLELYADLMYFTIEAGVFRKVEDVEKAKHLSRFLIQKKLLQEIGDISSFVADNSKMLMFILAVNSGNYSQEIQDKISEFGNQVLDADMVVYLDRQIKINQIKDEIILEVQTKLNE